MSTPQNMLLVSEQFDNVFWVKTLATITPNATAAPDGTVTADLVTDSVDGSDQVHACLQAVGVAAIGGQVYTFSIYLKDASGGAHPWAYVSSTSGASGVVVSTLDGTVGTASADLLDYAVEDVGNGWWRVTVTTRTPTSFVGFSAGAYTAASGTVISYTGTGSARFYMWGAQATRGFGPQPYVKTTTAYYDDGRPCRARVLTEQNLATWSEALTNAAWLKDTGVTVTDATSDVTDPLGGNTASKVVYAGGGSAGTFNLDQGGAMGSSRYTGEIGSVGVWIRTLSGSFTLQITENWSAALSTITITSAWQFFSRSAAAIASNVQLHLGIYKGAADNASRTFYVWHPQVTRGVDYLGPYSKTQGNQVGGGPGRQLRPTVQRAQNMLGDPGAFDAGSWSTVDLNVNNDVLDSPLNDGLSLGDQLLEATTTNVHTILQNLTSPGEGRVVTLSCWFQYDGSRQYVGLRMSTLVGAEATFDLINGVVVHSSGLIEAGVGPLQPGGPNGWWRVWITARIADNSGVLAAQCFLSDTSGAYHVYAGNSSNGCYAWGMQLNVGGLQPYADTGNNLSGSPAQRKRAVIPQNLVPYSEQFDQASVWTPNGTTVSANAIANPINGAVDADALHDTVANSAHNIFQAGGSAISFAAGSAWCASVYVKLAKSGTAPVVLLSASGAGGGGGCYFNLVTGARANVFFPDTYSRSEPLGGGWFRLSIFGKSHDSSGTQISISAYADTVGTTYLGDGAVAFYIWGAQVTSTWEPVPYVKSGSSPVGFVTVPSGDIAPARGQLVLAMNMLDNSEQFNSWTPVNLTVTANSSAGPFGTGTPADTFVETVDGGTMFHVLYQQPNPPRDFTVGELVTFSVYLKPIVGSSNFALLLCNSQTGYAIFDLVAGQLDAILGSTPVLSASCEQAGGGWLRCSITYNATVNDISIASAISAGGGGHVYTGTGRSLFYMFGAQLNVGASPLPYVPSVAFPEVNADVRASRGAS